MPFARIELRPGVSVELTPTKNADGGFSRSQLVRFFAGQVQKLGGWARLPNVSRLIGTCRGLYGWADLVGTAHLAAGTDQRLYTVTGGVLGDITPLGQTDNLAPAFATTAGSTAVSVQDAGASPRAGDTVNIVTHVAQGGLILYGAYAVTSLTSPSVYVIQAASQAPLTNPFGGQVASYATQNASPTVTVTLAGHSLGIGQNYYAAVSTVVGGVTVFGNYTVQSILDASTFTIQAASPATSTATLAENSGNARIQYPLGAGVSENIALGGWGTGDWGAGDWGLSTAGTTSSLIQHIRTWSLTHFGQDLIASPDLGKIYYWEPPTVAPAATLPNAPTINKLVFAMTQVQMIVACGTDVAGVYYPTLIRWCDSGDFTDWVASSTNQAGSYQLPTGSYITAGMSLGLGALIWTDNELYSMTYQGLPYVFGFNQIGDNCEALSKKAPAAIGSLVIWPSLRSFHRYSGGGVVPMECPVWDYFFNNLNPLQTDAVFSAVNSQFNEVSWFFPKLDGTIGYVKYNYLGNTWDYGALPRVAWTDHTPYGNAMGVDDQGLIQQHETSNDADGSALTCFAETGYYDIGEGTDYTSIKVMIPDFVMSAGASLQLTILATNYPNETPREYGPYTVLSTTKRINVSLRGRQIAFRFGSSDVGSFWRLGAVRYQGVAAGRR